MIDCPSLNLDHGQFAILLDTLSYINFFLNPFVIYCIIFRSTKFASSYRWWLLYHQIVSFIGDISFSFLGKFMVLMPFTLGYSAGLFPRLLPKRYWVVWCVGCLCFTVVTILHLFIFRFLTVMRNLKFPFIIKGVGVLILLLGTIPAIGVHFSYRDEGKILEEWTKNYTCITPEILEIPNLIAYNRSIIANDVIYPCLSLIVSAQLFEFSLIFFCLRAIRIKTMSAQLKRMQRLFLFQLILQSFVPILILLVPGLPFVLIMAREIYGYEFMGTLAMASLSGFSLTGAIVLIVMNPSYHNWLYDYFKKTKLEQRSTVVVVS